MEKEVKELKDQIKQLQTKENQFHQNQFERKRPLSRFDYEDNDNEDIQYIIKKKERTLQELFMKKKVKKKKTMK